MKIGVSSYSFSQYIQKNNVNYHDIIDIAKRIGFDGFEFINLDSWNLSDNPMKTAADLREYCAKVGMDIPAYTVGANFLADDVKAEVARVKECVDVAAELGAKVMRHDVTFAPRNLPRYTYRDAIRETVPYIREVTEYAAQKGVITCTENHGTFMQDPERVEELIRAVDHPNYGWLVDMGNFICADCDSVRAVSIAAPYAVHVHAKDFLWKNGQNAPVEGWGKSRGGNYWRGTVLGHGVIPVNQCVEILRKSGYDGYFSLEFEGWEDNIRALEAGCATLKACAEKQ